MLGLVLILFVGALITGVLGFTGIAIGLAAIAKVIFFIFLVLFLISLVVHLFRQV